MSWNRIVLILLYTLSLATQSTFAHNKIPITEDELIMRALLYDEYKAYENSYQVYKKLFDETGVELYLFREASSALLGRIHISDTIERLKLWDKKHPNKLEVMRLLIPLYLTNRQIDKAKEEATFLLEKSTAPTDMDLASNAFLYAGEYKRALALLEKIYATSPRESILLRMVELMDGFTGERKKAIQLLETHRRMNLVVSHDVYRTLLLLYQKEKDIDGILETYKALYENSDSDVYLRKIIDAYLYKRDIDGAIEFLETHHVRNRLLYELYKMKKAFTKAIKLLDLFYQKDNNPKWLAEKGILTFEKAKDKKDEKMLHESLGYLKKAIDLGNDDSVYLNYYGYTLIDKEIDIQKGMHIIQDALQQQPDNTYYLDSLAWGYYKQGECTQAYRLMKRVVDEEGLKEDEIKKHWQLIKQCK